MAARRRRRRPERAGEPGGPGGATGFQAECFGNNAPKLDLSYVWDPATQKYHGIADSVATSFAPSPDGKKALVQRGLNADALSWGVADWSDAVAGHVTQHPLSQSGGVRWSSDGKEVVGGLYWVVAR